MPCAGVQCKQNAHHSDQGTYHQQLVAGDIALFLVEVILNGFLNFRKLRNIVLPLGDCNPNVGAVVLGGIVGDAIGHANHFAGGNNPFKMSLQGLPGREGIGAITHAVPAEGSYIAVTVQESIGAVALAVGLVLVVQVLRTTDGGGDTHHVLF